MKAFCLWCECNQGSLPKNGYIWLHMKCAEEMMDIKGDLKSINEILQGIHPRNTIDEDRLKTTYDFIKDMEQFRKQWEGSMKIIEELRNNK